MDARRTRILAASAFALGLLVSPWVAPVAAADCALSAPATVEVGTPLVINGSDFPASSIVDIELTIEGGTADEFSVQSNAAGGFQLSLTPEEADAGKTTVVATAGSACSAQVVFTVLGPNDVAPTAEPDGPNDVAPTAEPDGPAAAASGQPDAPRTDTTLTADAGTPAPPLTAWLLAAIVLAIGVGGLIATRRTSDR